MKLKVLTLAFLGVATFITACPGLICAAEVDFPNIRRYPPGYYGAAYYSRLYPSEESITGTKDPLIWDKTMSRELGVGFPFYPKPYPWDYGRDLNFNFPDFNCNDWH